MNEKGLIDKVKEIVQDDLLGLERGQRELEGENGIPRLTVGGECVKEAQTMQSPSSSTSSKAIRKALKEGSERGSRSSI